MGFLGGAALLTAAVAVSKLLGALYKIPLGNLLGSRGMGCFQAAYNVYGVLLTLSTAGLPLAMSRLIAQSRGRPRRQRRIFHVALALFLALGLVGSGVMLTFPRQLAGLLHNELAAPSIRVLAPALLAVCLLSAIRGYPIKYPVVFDWEFIDGAEARTDGMDGETMTQCAAAFCELVSVAGYTPMIYFNQELGYLFYQLDQLDASQFWLAEYDAKPDFFYDFEMWQYTHTGVVPGIQGNVDLNLAFQRN